MSMSVGRLRTYQVCSPSAIDRQIGFERRRIHRNQDIWGIAGGADGMTAEMDLKGRYTEQGTLRRPNFSRKIRKSGQVIPSQCSGQSELPPRSIASRRHCPLQSGQRQMPHLQAHYV